MTRDKLKLVGKIAARALSIAIPPNILVGVLVLVGVITPKTWFHSPLTWFIFSLSTTFLIIFTLLLVLALKFPNLYNRY
jgi:hypothetical protein